MSELMKNSKFYDEFHTQCEGKGLQVKPRKPLGTKFVKALPVNESVFINEDSNFAYKLSTPNEDDLRLTPLTKDHLRACHQQLSELSVTKLCNLPNSKDQDWFTWFYNECTHTKQQIVFAVMHKQYGFIGTAAIEIHAGVGFIYYWLGKRYQGKGFAVKAVRNLLSIGVNHLGLNSCYAKVYQSNIASQKTLTALNFKIMPFEGKFNNEIEFFYYWGRHMLFTDCYAQLSHLFQVMESDF